MSEPCTTLMGRRAPVALLLAAGLALSACGGDPAADVAAAPAAQAVPNLQPDSRGVISYATYQVAVAQSGDTLASVASRVGTTSEALAQRNALPADYLLREGEVLLLPDGVSRPAESFGTDVVTTQPLGAAPGSTATAAAPAANPFQNGQTEPLIDPVRHRVEAGETAYSIARLYGVSVTALASWNGLGPDLAVRENQELLIPIVSDANRISSGPEDTQPGQGTPIAPPPSASAPLPDDITAAVAPESPNLGALRTPPGGRLSPPVSGSVARQYNPASPNGIGFDVPAGTPVRAAAPGEVALISEALGGLGTIVLVRHRDDLITTYSTLSEVRVTEGDQVQTGQVLGVVANRDDPELQFDVFRGTTSVDPTPYLAQ
jgi:murein DD-endopeptidase MepM/ murein hydrolase activator NlpD